MNCLLVKVTCLVGTRLVFCSSLVAAPVPTPASNVVASANFVPLDAR
jgi:hypothetical protein